MRRAAVVLLAFTLSGCGTDLFAPYCDDLGVYPQECSRHGTTWVCSSGGKVCNDGGYELHYDCKDYGGTYCKVR